MNSTNPTAKQRQWYVIYTMPKAEKKVSSALGQMGIGVFLPMYEEIVQWSDRKKRTKRPLFPGYVFVNLAPKEIGRAYGLPGMLRFLTTNGVKDVVPESDITQIRLLLGAKPERCANARWHTGQEVQVLFGPMAGLQGTLIHDRGNHRLIVNVKSIQQSVLVDVSASHVQLVATSMRSMA